MPRVPLPQIPQSTERSGVFTAPRTVPPASFTGQQIQRTGQAAETAGLQLSLSAMRAKERLDVAAAKEAQALAEERIQDNGYLTTVGKAAIGPNRDKAWEALKTSVTTIGSGLENEEQRGYFEQVMRQRLLQVRAQWGAHEDQQLRAYEIGSGQAALEAKILAAGVQNPGEIGQEPVPQEPPEAAGVPRETLPEANPDLLRTVRGEATTLAIKRFGPGAKDQVDAFVREAVTRVHVARIARMADSGRGTEAAAYLAKVKDEMTLEGRLRMEGVVRQASVGEEGLRTALDIADQITREHQQRVNLSQAPAGLLPGVDEAIASVSRTGPLWAADFGAEARRRVQDRYDKGEITFEVLRQARGEINRMEAEREKEQVAATDGALRRAEQWMIENPQANLPSAPPSVLQDLSYWNAQDVANRFSGSTGRYPTHPEFFMSLFDGTNDVLQKPAEEALAIARPQLSPAEFETFKTMWAKANKVDSAATDSFEFVFTKYARDNRMLDRTSREADKRRSAEFINTWEDAKRRWRDMGSKPEAMEKAISDAFADKVWTDWGSDRLLPVGALTKEQFTGFSEADRERMFNQGIEMSPNSGAYVTADQMVQTWNRGGFRNVYGNAPDYIPNSDIVYIRQITPEVRLEIANRLQAKGLPTTEVAIAIEWVRSGSPKTVDEPAFPHLRGK